MDTRINEAFNLPLPPKLTEKYGYAPAFDCRFGYTKITCIHNVHPHGVLYMAINQYQESFIPLTGTLWANGYTFLIQSMD